MFHELHVTFFAIHLIRGNPSSHRLSLNDIILIETVQDQNLLSADLNFPFHTFCCLTGITADDAQNVILYREFRFVNGKRCKEYAKFLHRLDQTSSQ